MIVVAVTACIHTHAFAFHCHFTVFSCCCCCPCYTCESVDSFFFSQCHSLLLHLNKILFQIIFPDVNDVNIKPIKKSQVTITGTIDGVYKARQQLIVCIFHFCILWVQRKKKRKTKHTVSARTPAPGTTNWTYIYIFVNVFPCCCCGMESQPEWKHKHTYQLWWCGANYECMRSPIQWTIKRSFASCDYMHRIYSISKNKNTGKF